MNDVQRKRTHSLEDLHSTIVFKIIRLAQCTNEAQKQGTYILTRNQAAIPGGDHVRPLVEEWRCKLVSPLVAERGLGKSYGCTEYNNERIETHFVKFWVCDRCLWYDIVEGCEDRELST